MTSLYSFVEIYTRALDAAEHILGKGVTFAGEKGIADLKLFAGIGTMGGTMFRDFAIVSTAMGASLLVMKRTGWVGVVSLFLGIFLAFVLGVGVAFLWGYRDAVSH